MKFIVQTESGEVKLVDAESMEQAITSTANAVSARIAQFIDIKRHDPEYKGR